MKTTSYRLAHIALALFLFCIADLSAIALDKDEKWVQDWIRRAESGDEISQILLGLHYQHEDEYEEAFKWFLKAAKQNNPFACRQVGLTYEHGTTGVVQDYQEAINWYQKSIQNGGTDAMYNLGVMYHTGRGVTPDSQLAIVYYRRASDESEYGCRDAENLLGGLYYYGVFVPQSYKEASTWYHKAAENGSAPSQFQLAQMYSLGKGIVQDYKKSVKWYRRVAQQDYVAAQYFVGLALYEGKGVPQDYVKAHMWFNLAGAHDTHNLIDVHKHIPKDARKQRDVVAEWLAPSQLAQAQQLAREWKPIDERYEILIKRLNTDKKKTTNE